MISKRFIIPLCAAVFLMVAGCAVTHLYGPYYGRVVDADTREPIGGAVVLLRFETDTYRSGEVVSRYADAVETVTDGNGEFRIPAHRSYLFRFFNLWIPEGKSVVFKPGYGCFPKHPGARLDGETEHFLPADTYVTILLPRLRSLSERKANLSHIYTPGVPEEKMPRLMQLKHLESVAVDVE